MLKFIKKLFAKEETREEPKEEGIGINALNEWLDVKAKPIFEELNSQISEIANRLNNKKQEALNNLNELEEARLQNPKIPEMAKIVMEGNRAAFIRKTAFFFNNISLEHSNYGELIKKCEEIEAEIDSLGKSTARSYMVLNEFFSHEVEKVAAGIKHIETYAKDAKNAASSSEIQKIAAIKSDIEDAQKKIKLREGYSEELKNEKINLGNNERKKIGIESKINEMKSGNDYKNYENLLEERKNIEAEIREIENMLFHDFSVLERPLRKYAKTAFENEDLIALYMGNPVKALAYDNNLEIAKILASLEKALGENKLGLDRKKSEKTLAKIKEMDKGYFNDLRGKCKKSDERLAALDLSIEANEARNELENLSNELKMINENIGKINNEILNLTNEIEKIDVYQLKEDLKKEIKETINEEIAVL